MKPAEEDYERLVFINCPFDEEYLPLFRASTFAVMACGYVVRSALQDMNAGEVRMNKILRLIKTCRFGIHDVSRTALDPENQLPRFSMPLELGLFLGAAHFGNPAQRRKQTLVLDVDRHRYQKFISDIAGQDIKAHGNDPDRVIGIIRDWLNAASSVPLPGGKLLARRYRSFLAEVPPKLVEFKLH
ncbi:MAG: hypothetical protein K1X78_23335 [Verrucomicrobiaceae bacterium]|nr:hypothetical protein [Verrucomicrobiaceae bacterium]